MVEPCAECGRKTELNKKCEYCNQTYCDDHMSQHMAWERRHENLAEETSKLWKKRTGG